MNKNTAFLVGFVAAAAAGAIAGLLLAPKKGSELREDLKAKSTEISDQIKRLARKGKQHFDDYENELNESAQHA